MASTKEVLAMWKKLVSESKKQELYKYTKDLMHITLKSGYEFLCHSYREHSRTQYRFDGVIPSGETFYVKKSDIRGIAIYHGCYPVSVTSDNQNAENRSVTLKIEEKGILSND